MGKENEFFFNDWNSFKTKACFEVMTWDESFEAEVDISCAEDLQEVMRLFFTKDWKALFYDYNEAYRSWYKDIVDVAFVGLCVVVKEKDKGLVCYRLDTTQKMNVAVDTKTLRDENARKIEEIRKIIGR